MSSESDTMEFLKKSRKEIDRAIRRYLPRRLSEKHVEWLLGRPGYAYSTRALDKSLSEPIWEYLDRGGKRWRPALFLLFTDALGGDREKVMDFTVTLEMLHEGSILVDDIEDDSDLRRGKPCTHRIFGNDVAINAGNFMYFISFFPIIKNRDRFSPQTMLKVWDAVAQETTRIHYGQAVDIAWHRGLVDAKKVTEKEYIQMCAYKTGVLARLAARLAVILQDGGEEMEEKLGKFAESIGVAFQIQDDIMNITASENLGKEFGDDINEGKITLMVIHTLKHARKKERERLLQILGMHTKDEGLVREAIGIMEGQGSIEYARKFASDMVDKAWSEAKDMIPGSEARKQLGKFAKFMVTRKA